VIVKEILQRSTSWLAGKGFPSARLEAELLLAHVLGVGRLDLYTASERPLERTEIDAYRTLLRRRAGGEPVAYLTGEREFYGLAFRVDPAVLVPRPETELLVDRARELRPATVLDLGTGCGCIAVACAVRLPEAVLVATDVSAEALAIAEANARRHDVAERIRFLPGDLFAPLAAEERFDLVVSNPPYVPEGQAEEVGRHEPRAALYAGADGLDLLRRIVAAAPDHLAPGGTLLAEIGEDQGGAVRALAEERFANVTIHPDLAGLPRFLEAS
jgi:release factor glutamine methyltransferase